MSVSLTPYVKTWLQLAFPVYIISLVVIIIIVSEYSPRFAALIGRKDPIATLATLILLSYAKLLSLTITALSSADINYPDGTKSHAETDAQRKQTRIFLRLLRSKC